MLKKLLILFFLNCLVINSNLIARTQTTLDYQDRIHAESSKNFMVVSQNSHATKAGYEILNKGGNAVDAAVAVGFALAVTLPRAGNLGGGGFMLIYSKKNNKVDTIDYRSAAPRSAKSEMYINGSNVVRFGHLVNAVPGSVAGLIKAHEKHGSLSLADVMKPAIRLAKEGIPVTDDLNYALEWSKESLLENPTSKNKFYDEKEDPIEVSSSFRQPKLAKTLFLISREGKKAFYEGEIAKWIEEDSLNNGGLITLQDLASYEAKDREQISINYRGYKVVSMAPVASGGLVLLQILSILKNFDLEALGPNSAKAIHLLSESMQRAYADRARYHGAPDYYDVPIKKLLSDKYLRDRSKSITNYRTEDGKIYAGDMSKVDESPDTTHFSVIDSKGNAVSNTYTLGSSFGSGVTIKKGGFLMNNQMRNFSHFYGTSDDLSLGTSEANKLEPGKRMISTQTPTLVFNPKGELFMVLGSPGGGRIPNIIAQVISNVIDHNMSYASAVMAPRINQRLEGDLEIEDGFSPDTISLLKTKGHNVKSSLTMGSVQAIFIKDEVIYGVADTRRPGALAKGN